LLLSAGLGFRRRGLTAGVLGGHFALELHKSGSRFMRGKEDLRCCVEGLEDVSMIAMEWMV
jgi:hypothetical protein